MRRQSRAKFEMLITQRKIGCSIPGTCPLFCGSGYEVLRLTHVTKSPIVTRFRKVLPPSQAYVYRWTY